MHEQLRPLATHINRMSSALLDSSDPISYTAQIVAAKRAIEQLHPSPLFNDPYAAALAGEEVNALISRWRAVANAKGVAIEQVIAKRTRYIALRTKFMDDLIHRAQSAHGQVVILGAGLDTRAYRLAWTPGTTVYEVDCPAVLHYKAQVLRNISSTCIYRPVAGDLATPDSSWADDLRRAGHQHTVPTIWLLEGVVMYLQEEEAHRLLQTLSALSASGSILGMDGVRVGSVLAGQRARNADRGRVVRHWQFGNDDPKQLLEHYGWATAMYEPQDIENGCGRYPQSMPIGTETADPEDGRGVWLIHAVKE